MKKDLIDTKNVKNGFIAEYHCRNVKSDVNNDRSQLSKLKLDNVGHYHIAILRDY